MMPNKLIYEYAIIRLVPKVEREEFINVGAILLCRENQFLEMKTQLNKEFLQQFAHDVDLNQITNYLQAWQHVCDGSEKGGKIGALEVQVRFRWLTANRSTIIQTSAVHSGLTKNPQVTLEQIYNKFVN